MRIFVLALLLVSLGVGNSSLTQSSRELEKSSLDGLMSYLRADFPTQPTNLAQDTRIALANNLDSAPSQNLVKNNLARSANLETRPLRGAKNRIQASSSASADFLLEAEKRGSPPKSEKAAAFWRVGGAGRGVQPFLREKTSEISGEGGAESSLDSAIPTQKAKSPQDAEFAKDEFATCKDDITGFWLSPRDKISARTSIIEIFKKDGKYFAYNVAFLDELPPKKDALNQNFSLRDREILGSVYAYNLERSGEASYINGRYYDFNRGKIFHLKAKLDCDKLILLISADNVGFLGKKKIYKALEKSEAEFYIKTRPTIDFSGVK